MWISKLGRESHFDRLQSLSGAKRTYRDRRERVDLTKMSGWSPSLDSASQHAAKIRLVHLFGGRRADSSALMSPNDSKAALPLPESHTESFLYVPTEQAPIPTPS